MKRILATLALGGAAALASALPASASTVHHYAQLPGLAITQLSNRLDNGYGGYWATDTIQRDLTIHHVGGNSYTATVTGAAALRLPSRSQVSISPLPLISISPRGCRRYLASSSARL